MKPKKYIAGLYFRLSQEDERQGESASIDNQRTMLRKYAEEHSFEIHDEYAKACGVFLTNSQLSFDRLFRLIFARVSCVYCCCFHIVFLSPFTIDLSFDKREKNGNDIVYIIVVL